MTILKENSHMPFRAKLDGHEVLFFCTIINGVWKVHFQVDNSDEVFKVQTQTLDKDVECAPTISPAGNGRYVFSFVSGQAKRCLFYSEIDHFMALTEPFEKKMKAVTYAGFVSSDRSAHIIQKKDHAYILISDNMERVLMLPEGFCYRVSFRFDKPEILLISGAYPDQTIYSLLYDLATNRQQLLYDGDIPAYKASIYEKTIEYAQKIGEDFEDRRIVRAADPVFIDTNIAEFITKTEFTKKR